MNVLYSENFIAELGIKDRALDTPVLPVVIQRLPPGGPAVRPLYNHLFYRFPCAFLRHGTCRKNFSLPAVCLRCLCSCYLLFNGYFSNSLFPDIIMVDADAHRQIEA